jgi:Viral BACON domain/Putative binding domain, N-terminal
MRPSILSSLHAAVLVVISVAGLLALSGCGSSTSTATAPAVLPRCGVTVTPMDGTAPAQGASGQLTIKTERECAWTALSETSWLSIKGIASGQGDGAIEYTVASNADPVTRRGTIAVNDQHPAISQAAAECTIRLSAASASFALTGGTGSVDVQPSSAMCTWTASSEASWIVVNSGASGTGNGTVRFTVEATTGPARTGDIVIGSLRFNITQSEGCTYSVAPSLQNVPSGGGSGTIAVTTAAGCPWTAASNANWISIASNASSTGPGSVSFAADTTTGPSRTGTLLIAGQTVTITQSSACAFTVSPTTHNVGSGAGSASLSIGAAAGCAWTASSDVPWITIAGQTSGTGGTNVTLNVAANSGGARTGTLTIAGQTVTVTQGEGCSFSIAPESQNVDASGGNGSVSVTASAGCNWTAASNANWITVTSGSSGTGNGTVQFSAASTTAARSGTITIAGKTFAVNQGQPQTCTIGLASANLDIGVGGGPGSVQVTAGGGCAWTATTNAPWITINSGSSGNGNGTVAFTVGANTGGARTGTISIGGQTFTVNQAQACAVGISPASSNIAGGGGNGSINVTASNGCAWTTTAGAPWITITAGQSGSGNGTVGFTAAANTGAARSASITVGGQVHTVNQAAGNSSCTYSLAPANQNAPAAGGNGSVNVTAGSGCAWTASKDATWLTITGGASGSGNGTVAFSAAANTGPARTATITVAGQTATVQQAAGCTFTIKPTEVTVKKQGDQISVAVSTAAGCSWTATSPVSWITIDSGASGTGNGKVVIDVDRNTGNSDTRTANVIIAGLTLKVTQQD